MKMQSTEFNHLFKLGYQTELANHPPRRRRNALLGLAGAGAAGAAYLADQRWNGGEGWKALTSPFRSSPTASETTVQQPPFPPHPPASVVVRPETQAPNVFSSLPATELSHASNISTAIPGAHPNFIPDLLRISREQAHEASTEQRLEGSSNTGHGLVYGAMSVPQVAARLRQIAARKLPLPSLTPASNLPLPSGFLGRAGLLSGKGPLRGLGPLGGAAGGYLDADIAEHGLAGVNLGEKGNRAVGAATGALVGSHPVGMLGQAASQLYLGHVQHRDAAIAHVDGGTQLLGDAMTKMYQRRSDPMMQPFLDKFVSDPTIQARMNQPDMAEKYPVYHQLWNRLQPR